jgi:hypothetical protein
VNLPALAAFLLGGLTVTYTLLSALRTFVLPRSTGDRLSGAVFRLLGGCFRLVARHIADYPRRDAVLAFLAPVALLALVPTWLLLVALGYAAMFWALGVGEPERALYLSGSSLLTLGMAQPEGLGTVVLTFSEATIGLMLVALLISYLPTMYTSFSRREAAVTMLEVRAGSPPSALELLQRYHRIHGLARLEEVWVEWERWFSELEETHTSLSALAFFRSPVPDRSWITAAGAVLDAASLTLSAVDIPKTPEAALCIRSGYIALGDIAHYFGLPHAHAPRPTDPILVRREEFDAAWERLAVAGLPLVADRDQAWRDFAGWRVNYDTALVSLCAFIIAPAAPWSSDRSAER